MHTRSKLALIIALLACLVVFDHAVRGDYVVLNDGTVLEGTVLPRGDGYWVKNKDGETRTVKGSEVKSAGKGAYKGAAAGKAPGTGKAKGGTKAKADAKAGAAGAASDAPVAKPKKIIDYATAERRAKSVEVAMAAVTIWQEFIDSEPASAEELAEAKKALAHWQKLADGSGEKIKGKWVAGEERDAIVDKAQALYKESAEMMAKDQTLQAIEKLKESVALYPNSFHANFLLAYINLIQHKPMDARKYLEKAQQIRPNSPEVLSNLALIEIDKRQHVRAIEMFYKAAQAGDNKAIVQNLMAAIATAPRNIMNNQKVKPAVEAARLLAARHGISGGNTFIIVPLSPDEVKGGSEGDPMAGGVASGTGFIISKDGLILTNRHVVEGGKSFLVLINGKAQRSAEVVVMDADQDLALIRVKPDDGEDLPIVQLSEADAPGDGAACTVMGYPMIDRLGAAIKITRGVVSSSSAKIAAGPDVVIDAKVNPGNSGGPILDKHGNVMAIVSMKTIASGTEDSYGLGISAGRIRKFLEKNKVEVKNASAAGAAVLDAEEIATKVKPAAVCILATQ